MNNTQYFEMSDNTAESKGWTYAPRFYYVDKLIQYNCSKCGATASYPVGKFAIDLEGGTKYPDILLCGAFPLLIVSERVVNDWDDAGIIGFERFLLEIKSINSNKLKSKERVHYYGIEVTAKCDLDLDAMNVKVVKECSECGKIILSKPSWEIEKLIIKPETVGNADIFVSSIFPRKILVSEKLIKCACDNRHTNFKFVKAEESFEMFSEAIDYLNFC